MLKSNCCYEFIMILNFNTQTTIQKQQQKMLGLIQHICLIGKNMFTFHSIKLCSLIVRIIGSNLCFVRNGTIIIKNEKNYLSIEYDVMRMENKNESRYSCARAAVH